MAVRKPTWTQICLLDSVHEAVGALSGWLTRAGTELFQATVRQPPLSPPGAVFPIVWAVLYALMGAGAARIWTARASGNRSRALALYLIQLFFNFFWSVIFFNFQRFDLALLWLIALWG
jgi:tryptophan-rich sensory protein